MNRTPLALIAAASLCLTAAHHAHATVANFAQFSPASWSGTTAPTGTLDGVGFTISFGGASPTSNNASANLTSATFDGEGGANQAGVAYTNASSFTITFASAIDNFSLYLYFFRTDRVGAGGSGFYDFGRSDFTLNAAFTGGMKQGTGIITNSGVSFASGIARFSGPVTSLTVTGAITNPQIFTFSGTSSPVAIPGAGLAVLATVALAGVSRRRRR